MIQQKVPDKKQIIAASHKIRGENEQLKELLMGNQRKLVYLIDQLFIANPRHIVFQQHYAGGAVATAGAAVSIPEVETYMARKAAEQPNEDTKAIRTEDLEPGGQPTEYTPDDVPVGEPEVRQG